MVPAHMGDCVWVQVCPVCSFIKTRHAVPLHTLRHLQSVQSNTQFLTPAVTLYSLHHFSTHTVQMTAWLLYHITETIVHSRAIFHVL